MTYTTFYEAFQFLDRHPRFRDRFADQALDIAVVKVNPETEMIEDNKSLNAATRVWLECGDYEPEHGFTHDVDLDTGGATFEEAIINLANLVVEHYGTYTEADRLAAEDEWYQEALDRSKTYEPDFSIGDEAIHLDHIKDEHGILHLRKGLVGTVVQNSTLEHPNDVLIKVGEISVWVPKTLARHT